VGSAELALEVDAGGYEKADEQAASIRRLLGPGSGVRTWQDLNGPLFFVLRLEKVMIFVAVFLIVLVAALALVADLSLLIANKRGEVGILGTVGAAPRTLRRAFVLLGGALAISGVAAGTVLGVGTAWILDHYRLLPVPSGVYFLDYVPFAVRPQELLATLGATLVVALSFARWAAGRATAQAPVEALRR
jgi:lipoprotein-releasing system permease protein